MMETPEQVFDRMTPRGFRPSSVPKSTIQFAGFGDVVYVVASRFGFKTCGRCNKRRAWLNRHTPRWLARVLGGIVKHLVPRRR